MPLRHPLGHHQEFWGVQPPNSHLHVEQFSPGVKGVLRCQLEIVSHRGIFVTAASAPPSVLNGGLAVLAMSRKLAHPRSGLCAPMASSSNSVQRMPLRLPLMMMLTMTGQLKPGANRFSCLGGLNKHATSDSMVRGRQYEQNLRAGRVLSVRYLSPLWSQKRTGIEIRIGKPVIGCDNATVSRIRQPCCPPRKRTIRNYEELALGHQMEVDSF